MGRRELLRINARLEVEFKNFDQFFLEYTKNISKGGIFIKTENVLKTQDVVELVLRLPGVSDPLRVVGEVVHVINPELAAAHGWESGMGIHFVDFEEGAHQELESYIAKMCKEAAAQKCADDRRKHPRVAMRLRVKFPSLDVLQHDYSDDISHGGIFIQTQKARQIGDRFIITLVHPETAQEIELLGEVVRITHHDPQAPGSVTGMGIKFIEMDDEKKKAVDKFLGTKLG